MLEHITDRWEAQGLFALTWYLWCVGLLVNSWDGCLNRGQRGAVRFK